MTTDRDALVKHLQEMFPEQEGFTISDQSYAGISYGTVRKIIALLTAPAEAPVAEIVSASDAMLGTGPSILWHGYPPIGAKLYATPPRAEAEVRAAVIEECAKVCEGLFTTSFAQAQIVERCAAAIRALAAHPAAPGKETGGFAATYDENARRRGQYDKEDK